MPRSVTIGVPVYRGRLFLEESLNSILNQTYDDFAVIISVDEPDPECEEICSRFLEDSRFRMVIQPQRLGWMGNMNWLMSQVQTEFWHLQEQDDVIEREFLALLVAYARAHPAVATIYPDIRIFGNESFPIVQSSVVGSVYARQMALLSEHLSAVALIGLSRVEALRAAGGIPGNECENFFAETAWMAAMARWGELHRVPGELFHKRIHNENTVTSWFRWPREKRLSAWCVHCLSMLEEALRIEATLEERRSLWRAGVERLVSSRTAGVIIEVAELTLAERKSMLDDFLHRARALTTLDLPTVLDADWNEIDSFTNDSYETVSIRALGN
jgi:glycosyltransferase involved in cell wall biosynthesis